MCIYMKQISQLQLKLTKPNPGAPSSLPQTKFLSKPDSFNMCGHKRRAAPPPMPVGSQLHRLSRHEHSHKPGSHFALAINALAIAVDSNNDQITGVTRPTDLTPYTNDKHVTFKSEKEAEANITHIEDPPAYTPHASHPINSLPPQAQAEALAQHPTFTTLPILRSPTIQLSPNISADITHLSSALKSLQLGERGAKCAAKRAGRQLARDLWEVEVMKLGGQRGMSCAERRMVRAQIREVKGAVRGEIREMRCR